MNIHVARRPSFELSIPSEGGQVVSASDIGRIATELRVEGVVIFLRRDYLMGMPEIDWMPYDGPKLWWEWDACNDEAIFGLTDPIPGGWCMAMQKQHIDLILASGKRTTERLIQRGASAYWLPKAVDTGHFRDLRSGHREGIVHFGRLYAGRRLMLAATRRAGLPVSQVRTTYNELPSVLNSALACLICNREVDVSPLIRVVRQMSPRLGRKVAEEVARWPKLGVVRLGTYVEPMIKNFESAACGAAPLCDFQPELEELGFVDGESMLSYGDTSSLLDAASFVFSEPEQVAELGQKSAELVVECHDWAHRAAMIPRIIGALSDGRSLPPWDQLR